MSVFFKKLNHWSPTISCSILLVILFGYVIQALSIYPIDMLPSRTVKFDLNYSYSNASQSYTLYANKPGDVKAIEEYINRDSLVRMKFNSRRIHNYILTKFKYNTDEKVGVPNVLQCEALVTGYRNFWPLSLYPNILKIKCD